MTIGTTSFGFRYQLLDPERAPPLTEIVDQAAELGLTSLQICENARPLDLTESQWDALVQRATAAGVAIGLGCKTTRMDVFAAYLARAAALRDPMLRLVFEEESGSPPGREQVDRFLANAAPALQNVGVRLAIENHFDVPSAMLAEAVQPYPRELIGFCVDTANSLRNFESPEQVMTLLAPRAFCYHIKDFIVSGHLLGFCVAGAPLGKGALKLDDLLERIFQQNSAPLLFVENWVPATGDRETDIGEDDAWLRDSLAALRSAAAAGVRG
jgi:sugar phosphate isomerase/epimerase